MSHDEQGDGALRARIEATGFDAELSELAKFVRIETGHVPTARAVVRLRDGIRTALAHQPSPGGDQGEEVGS